MTSALSTIEYLLEQTSRAGHMRARKMFGDYALYCDDKVVALVCDDQLYVKPTPAGQALAGMAPAGIAYPGAKPSLLIAGERWEDSDWLTELFKVTSGGLPAPKPKPPRAAPATRVAKTRASKASSGSGPRSS